MKSSIWGWIRLIQHVNLSALKLSWLSYVFAWRSLWRSLMIIRPPTIFAHNLTFHVSQPDISCTTYRVDCNSIQAIVITLRLHMSDQNISRVAFLRGLYLETIHALLFQAGYWYLYTNLRGSVNGNYNHWVVLKRSQAIYN